MIALPRDAGGRQPETPDEQRRERERVEGKLVTLAREGDPDAFGKLCLRYTPKFKRWLAFKNMDEQTREDLLQDGFLKAYERIGEFDLRIAGFGTWVWKNFIKNQAMDALKALDRRKLVFVDSYDSAEPSLDAKLGYFHVNGHPEILRQDDHDESEIEALQEYLFTKVPDQALQRPPSNASSLTKREIAHLSTLNRLEGKRWRFRGLVPEQARKALVLLRAEAEHGVERTTTAQWQALATNLADWLAVLRPLRGRWRKRRLIQEHFLFIAEKVNPTWRGRALFLGELLTDLLPNRIGRPRSTHAAVLDQGPMSKAGNHDIRPT